MATLTINHYINEANSFIADIRDDRNGYFLFAARPQPWANSTGGNDESAVLTTNNSIAQIEQTTYDDMLYGKLLRDSDISHVIPRNNWVANTVYAAYDQNDANLYSKAFYVVTDNSEVYKCIDNNGGANSTVKPSLTTTAGVFKTGDGYVWKYMYTVDAASNTKFTTTDYIPVVPNTEVRSNALPGSIDVIKVTNGGNSYTVYETGYIGGVVVVNDETTIANRIQLPTTSSNLSGFYVNSSIYLKSGFGAGQIREIIASNGTSKEITLKESIQTFARLDLSNIQGTITTGYYAEQPYDLIDMLYTQGYFNANTTITQSDTGVSYIVLVANTSVIRGSRLLSNSVFTPGADLPFVDTSSSGTLEPGTVSVGNVGSCEVAFVVTPGSGYTANATVTIANTGETGSGATANAQSNAAGKIQTINITAGGTGYFTAPTVTISEPANTTFNANTAVTDGISAGTNNVIALSSAPRFRTNDQITYTVAAGNTAIGGLSNGTTYFVEFANDTVVALKTTVAGSRITLTKGSDESGHALKGQRATGVIFCDNQVVRGSGTQLNDATANGYANNEYIRIGANTTSNIRRVVNTVNTTALVVSRPYSRTFTATGRLTSIALSGATALGYNNNDIITVKSPIANSTNASVTFTTNSTGGSLTFTIASAGFGFVLGQVPVSNIFVTNSTGGTPTGNSTTTFLVANCATANQHFKMLVASEISGLTQRRARGYISNTNLSSVQLSITNSAIIGRLFSVGERAVMTDSARVSQGANAVIAYANSTSVILSGVVGTWLANSGGTQFFISGDSSQQLSQISDVTSNPNITINAPLGTFQLGYPIFFKTSPSGSVSGNATLVSKFVMPGDQTEYQIGPTVVITGDGSNAVAVAVVNTSANSRYDIIGIDVINPGSGYTEANVVIYANTDYGSGARANAIISPVRGHGFDPVTELGSRYVGINSSFDNLSNENYKFLGYGQYRKIGIIENPQFKDIRVTLTDFDRANFTLNAASYSSTLDWTPGEVVVQSTTNAAGVVVFGNTSFLELKNVKGTFNPSNTIYGYHSNTTANVITFAINRFPVGNTSAIVTQSNTGATGTIISVVNNTTYFMSNVVGQFADGDVMYDTVANAYATVESIFTANGTIDSSADFGSKFNQTARVTLTSHSGTFLANEYVQQTVSNARGRVISFTQEKDLVLASVSGSFSTGQTITDANTNANGICTFANATYLKLTNVSQDISFVTGDTINNGLGSTAIINQVFPVLTLSDVSDVNNFQAGANDIVGQTSGAFGRCNNQILIRNPDLVRDSGSVIYLESFAPVTRSATSKEEIKLVIKF